MNMAKHNLGTSKAKRSTKRLQRAIAPVFEEMEPRRLMSGTLTVAPANPNESIVLDVAANGGIIKIVNGAQTTYSPGQWSDVLVHGDAVTIRGSTVPVTISTADPGNITIGGPAGLQKIKANVKFNAAGQPCTFNINDTGSNIARSAVIEENIYGDIDIKNLAPAMIELSAASIGTLNLTTGGGDDTVTVYATADNSAFNLNSAGGTDTVTISGSGSGSILGDVTVNNSPSLTHLVVDDSFVSDSDNILAASNGTYDMIYGMTPADISYKTNDVADVTLKLPSGGSNVTVLDTNKPLKIVGEHTGIFFCDNIVIGGALGMTTIHAPVTISSLNGIYYLELRDQSDPNARLIQVNTDAATQMNSVTGMGGAAIQWPVNDPAIVTLHTSNVGGNGIVVRKVDANNLIKISGSAPIGTNDTVTVGDSGSVQGIAGSLTIKNTAYTNLTIDDSADAAARSATLDIDNTQPVYEWKLSGLSPGGIFFNDLDVSAVTIKGGSGGNTFTLANTMGSNAFGSTPFNLSTGTGSDTVNVFGMMTGGVLNIEGQSGFDTVNCGQAGITAGLRGTINVSNAGQYSQLIVDDSADTTARTITLDAISPLPGDTHPRGRITGIVPGTINYRAYDMKDPLTIKGGKGGNTVTVNNTPINTPGLVSGNTINLSTGIGVDHVTVKGVGAGTTLNIDGQNGIDIVDVGNNGSVQGILGTLNLSNHLGFNKMTIDDSADATNRIFTIGTLAAVPGGTNGSITGLAPGIINYVAVDTMTPTIYGGSGANTYNVIGTPTSGPNGSGGPTTALYAGSGSDIINVTGMGAGTGVKVYGEAQDDALNVDYTFGAIPANHTITFDGGPGQGSNSMSIHGNAADAFAMTAGNIDKGANGHVIYSNIGALYAEGGTFDANGDMNLPALVAVGANTHLNFNTSQTIGTLYLDGAHAAVAAGGTNAMALKNLTIVNNAQLDLADNGMMLNYSVGFDPLTTMRGYLATGYNNGNWDGATGIISSTAKANVGHHTGIGFADSADGTGINSTPNSIKFVYTLYGDATLDKTVNTTDFNFLAGNFGGSNKLWSRGDFTYDGLVNTTDFNLLAANFGSSLPAGAARGVASSLFSSEPVVDVEAGQPV